MAPALSKKREELQGATPLALLRHPGLGIAGIRLGSTAAFGAKPTASEARVLVPWECVTKGYRLGHKGKGCNMKVQQNVGKTG